jgi:hypothetical protein
MAREIKFELSRVVSWGNTFIWNGVTVYDRCLYAAFEKDVHTWFQALHCFLFSFSGNIHYLPAFPFILSFVLHSVFKPKPDSVIFLIFCLGLSSSLIRVCENFSNNLLWFLIKYISHIRSGFKGSLPTSFVHEYNSGLTKRKSPLKKDPIPFPLCTLKLALYTGPMSPPPLW